MEQNPYQIISQFLHNGGSVRMLADIDPQDLQAVYHYASLLLQQSKVEEAKKLFYLLMNLDQWNTEYMLGLGLCYQATEGEQEQAIYCFSRAAMIAIDNPLPSYYIGKSYQLLNNPENVEKAFNMALLWCEGRSEYDELADSIRKDLGRMKSA